MRFERLTPGEVISAVAGLTLFGLMYGIWFEHPTAADIPAAAIGFQTKPDAWHALGVIDWVLVATVVCTLSAALLAATDSRIHLPLARSAAVAVMGAVSVGLIGYRIIDPITINMVSYRRDLAIFLAFGSAVLVTLGGVWSLRDQGTSLGAELGRAARREPAPHLTRQRTPQQGSSGQRRASRRPLTKRRGL